MTNMEKKYYQIPADGADSQAEFQRSQPRWFKPGMALISGSSLVLMCLMFTRQTNSAVESTNLIGLSSTSLRSSLKPGMINSMSPSMLCGSSPFKDLAISAIKANNLGVRDVSMMAAELEGAPAEVKETVEKVAPAVALKGKDIAKDMAGVTAPFGLFDPLGFATDCSEGKLLFYREVELKHGRVGMLAALGFLVGENFHPLFGGNIDVPSYVAFQQTPLQQFWPAVVVAIAIPEVFSVFTFESPAYGGPWTIQKGRVPGDLNFDPLGLKPQDPKELKEMQTKEINNGRLAMIAAAGMIAQELATGKKLF